MVHHRQPPDRLLPVARYCAASYTGALTPSCFQASAAAMAVISFCGMSWGFLLRPSTSGAAGGRTGSEQHCWPPTTSLHNKNVAARGRTQAVKRSGRGADKWCRYVHRRQGGRKECGGRPE